jgi:hypothetical protein
MVYTLFNIMNDHIVQTITDLEKKVAEYEGHALRVKTTINELCVMADLPPRYAAAALEKSSGGGFAIRSDQFHARPLATIVREYLDMRKRADIGPATLEEIFDALAQGGYESQAKDERIARIALNNALTKNPVFYKLPNKRWGLLEWYPKAKQRDEGGDDEVKAQPKSTLTESIEEIKATFSQTPPPRPIPRPIPSYPKVK